VTDFHKVKVIFVSEDVSNTSKYTNMLGGFAVVVILLDMYIL